MIANQVTLNQAVNIVATLGTNITPMLVGQPGIGKSSILKTLAERMPDYLPCYLDVSQLDLGDICMPVVDRDAMVTHYAPNARFGVAKGQNRPVILMLDELTKGSKPVMAMLMPVILERRIGDVKLPEGSIVFATGNLASDGVGDNALPGHAHNRLTVLDVANPDVDSWLQWAMRNEVAPEVCAFVKSYPQCLERYDQTDSTNLYCFDPLRGRTKAFTSPRSLEKASNIIKAREVLGDATLACLVGTIGEAAARDMLAFTQLADSVPSFEAIVKDPAKCRLPDGVGAYFLVSFMLAGRVKKETMTEVMTYVERWTCMEAVALFLSTVAGNRDKVSMACMNRAYTRQAAELGRFF